MGRLRYIGWTSVFTVAAALLSIIVLVAVAGTGIFHIHSEAEFVQILRVMRSAGGAIAICLIALIVIGWFVTCTLMTIQRSHDMGWSGWSVLILYAVVIAGSLLLPYFSRNYPLPGIVFELAITLFPYIWNVKPGTPDSSRFGPAPTPTPLAVQIFGWIFAALMTAWIIFDIVHLFKKL